MKRSTILRTFVIVSAVCVLGTWTGCGKNDNPPQESSTTPSMTESVSEVAPDSLEGQWQSESNPGFVYTFEHDGTGQYDMAGNVLNLQYTTDSGKITLTFLQEGYSAVTLDYVLEGDRLNIKDSFGNDTFYMRVTN